MDQKRLILVIAIMCIVLGCNQQQEAQEGPAEEAVEPPAVDKTSVAEKDGAPDPVAHETSAAIPVKTVETVDWDAILPDAITRTIGPQGVVFTIENSDKTLTTEDVNDALNIYKWFTTGTVADDKTHILIHGDLTVNQIQDVVHRLATWYPGSTPFWAELMNNPVRSDRYNPGMYRIVAVKKVKPGRREENDLMFLDVLETRGRKGVVVRFYDTSVELKKAGHKVSTVSIKLKQDRIIAKFLKETRVPMKEIVMLQRAKVSPKELIWHNGAPGRLTVHEFEPYCDCHYDYKLQILDSKKQLIWKYVGGILDPALVINDFDGDGIDEFVALINDHGKMVWYLFDRVSLKMVEQSDRYLQESKKLIQRKRYSDGLEKLNKSLEVLPTNPEAVYWKAYIYHRNGKNKLAERYYRECQKYCRWRRPFPAEIFNACNNRLEQLQPY